MRRSLEEHKAGKRKLTESKIADKKAKITEEGKELRKIPSTTRTGRKMSYIRYADD
jgi:hypothetical protein